MAEKKSNLRRTAVLTSIETATRHTKGGKRGGQKLAEEILFGAEKVIKDHEKKMAKKKAAKKAAPKKVKKVKKKSN